MDGGRLLFFRAVPAAAAVCLILTLGQVISSAQAVPERATVDNEAAASAFNGAEASRLAGRLDEALGRYEQIVADYAASQWAARAALESARCLVSQGKWQLAMSQMQMLRQRSPQAPEATQAFDRNAILHRLHLKPKGQVFRWARTAVDGNKYNVRRVIDVALDSKQQAYVLMRKALAVFSDSITPPTNFTTEEEFRAVDTSGTTSTLFEERGLKDLFGSLQPVLIPDQNRQREAEIQAAVSVGTDVVLVGDRRTRAIHRVTRGGVYQSRFGAGDVVKLAVSPMGEVAAIERETRAVLRFASDGSSRNLSSQGKAYQLTAPVDVAFDTLGHLYVLERTSVAVFDPAGELLATYVQENAPGSFRAGAAFDIDGAGRLYVWDEDASRLQVYH